MCLRFHCSGHVRRECRVPRCSICRRFGHDKTSSVKTYAKVAGPLTKVGDSELVMDEAEAEAAAGGGAGTPPPKPPLSQDNPVTPTATKVPPVQEAPVEGAAEGEEFEANWMHEEEGTAKRNEPGETDDDEKYASGAAAKKQRQENRSHDDKPLAVVAAATAREPPVRRSSFKPKPNVTTDRKAAATPPS